jgi:hypothetical protein
MRLSGALHRHGVAAGDEEELSPSIMNEPKILFAWSLFASTKSALPFLLTLRPAAC